jgi:hypothetical protein
MCDSLLDEALRYCDQALLEMRDSPERAYLRARHSVLERAAWSLSLRPEHGKAIVDIVTLALRLREDVVHAAAATHA